MTNDTENLLEMYTAVLVNLFKDIFMLVGIVVVMFRMNARLAWVVLSVMPVIIVVTVVFRIKARQAYRDVRTKLAKINAFIAENISGMRLVQIFRQERRKLQEFDDVNTEHLQASMREMKVYAVFRLSWALWLWPFSSGLGQDVIGITEFGTLCHDQLFGSPPSTTLRRSYIIMQSAMASAGIFQILDTNQDQGRRGSKDPKLGVRV